MDSRFNTPLETERLRAESLKVRADAIRTRIQAALNICNLIETQVDWGEIEKARVGMPKVWHAIEEIRRHIDEPGHVSSGAAEELSKRLAILELEARKVAKRLDARRDKPLP